MQKEKHTEKYIEIEALWKEGKGRKFIMDKFNISSSVLHTILKRLNLENKSHRSVNLSSYQKSVLIGTILGDTHILKGSKFTSSLNFAHCEAQKEYFDKKIEILKSLGISYNKEHNYFDKRTNKIYKRYTATTHSCIELKELRYIFYRNNKKFLPIEYLYNNFDSISLAYLYMDDGNTSKYNTTISTQSFEREELTKFCEILKKKFNLEFYVQKNLTIRLRQKDIAKFKNLIRSEVSKFPCMTYKL